MTDHQTRSNTPRKRSALVAMVGVTLALLIAGCGGSYGGASSAAGEASPSRSYRGSAGGPANGSATTPAPGGSAKGQEAAAAATGGIPQHDGGDQDVDNNGGPSDGDGNV
jgi:hypothetical protein